MNRRHICFVLDSYPPAIGGAETSLQNICEGLGQREFDITVITAQFGGSSPVIDKTGGCRVVRLRIPRSFRRMWFTLRAIPAVIVNARDADMIVGSTYGGVLPAFICSVLLGKKRLLMVHEVMRHRWFRFEKNPLKAFIYYCTERFLIALPFHTVAAVSEYTRNELLQMGVKDRSVVILYHGISDDIRKPFGNREDVRASLGFGKNDFLFFSYGRLGVTKGFQYLAHAIPDVVRQIPQARFLLLFSGYDRRIGREVDDVLAKISPEICGRVASVSREVLIDYIHAADCVAIPSLSEGFGFAALEACAAGVPLVVTRAGALPEVVYGSHVFVEPASAREIAEGCRQVFEGRASYTEPKDFRWETSIERWAEVLRSL
jgi:D-inositol-3-phosphate glycosyltransferase